MVIGQVQFIQDADNGGKYGTATVRITNPNAGFWMPSSDFVFAAKDASGGILGTLEGKLSMAPSAIKDLTPSQISYGHAGAVVDKVEFQLRPQPWRVASSYPAVSASASNIQVIASDSHWFSNVTGEVTNTSSTNQNIGIACTMWDSSGAFAGGAEMRINDLAPGVKSPFSATSLNSLASAKTATCVAQPQDLALGG